MVSFLFTFKKTCFFFTMKKRLCSGKVPLILKVLHGTIKKKESKKKMLLLRIDHLKVIWGTKNGSYVALLQKPFFESVT